MSDGDDSNLGEVIDVDGMLEVGFMEVELEEIKIGFEDVFEVGELDEDLFPGDTIGWHTQGGHAIGWDENLSPGEKNLSLKGKNLQVGDSDEDLKELLALDFMFGVSYYAASQVDVEGIGGLGLEEALYGGHAQGGEVSSGDTLSGHTQGGHTISMAREPLRGENFSLKGENLQSGDFYKVRSDVVDFYWGDSYDLSLSYKITNTLENHFDGEESWIDYEGFMNMDDINTFVQSEPRGGRSILEISGFIDEEAERNRKEKRERFW